MAKKLKCASCGMVVKKMEKGGVQKIVGMPGYNANTNTMKKGGATTKKYKKGGFPDLTGDGKVTRADILKGRGVIKKKGGSVKSKK